MVPAAPTDYHPVVLDRPGLQALIDVLVTDGRRVIGPTVRDGAVVYDEITQIGELPAGWADDQGPGRYRLRRRDDDNRDAAPAQDAVEHDPQRFDVLRTRVGHYLVG